MPVPIYVVNLSSTSCTGRTPLTIALPTYTSYSINQLPSDGPAVVYLVGHALPDVLFDGDQQIDEDKLAESLFRQRRDARTLIVGDLCYAGSLYDKLKTQSRHWAYLPSCAEHELSWHAGRAQQNETHFSRVFAEAMPKTWHSWGELEAYLQERTRSFQTPRCLPSSPEIAVSDFFPSIATALAS
jgi:hypothetical protein